MAEKILTNLNIENNDYHVVHGVKVSGLPSATTAVAKPLDDGILDLNPLIPAVESTDKGKSLSVNSEGTCLEWKAAGKVDDVKTGTVSRVTNKIAELPSMSKGTGANAIVLGSVNAANSDSRASGANAVAEGSGTTASGANSHAEGQLNESRADSSHVEGYQVVTSEGALYSHAEGQGTKTIGRASHAEGLNTIASGIGSHAEGGGNTVITTASGNYSHAEGNGSLASGSRAHAEGQLTIASNQSAHAEGNSTIASGVASHAEGALTEASGMVAHAEGNQTVASGNQSHAEGRGTIAAGENQHVQGKYNVEDSEGLFADIVGWGTAGARKNISSLTTEGDLHLKGDVYIQSDSEGKNGVKLVPTVSEGVAGYVLAVNSEGKQLEWVETNLFVLFGENKDGSDPIKDTYKMQYIGTESAETLEIIAPFQNLINLDTTTYNFGLYEVIPDTDWPSYIKGYRFLVNSKYQQPGDITLPVPTLPGNINVELDGTKYELVGGQYGWACLYSIGWAASDAIFDDSSVSDDELYITSWGSAPFTISCTPLYDFASYPDPTLYQNYWDPDGDYYYNYWIIWLNTNVVDPNVSHTIKIYV